LTTKHHVLLWLAMITIIFDLTLLAGHYQ